jgi:hypothetical protein
MGSTRFVLAALAVAAVASSADAQRPVRRRQPTIEIRGQVPTPQVVTVRPRAVPQYSRRVLVPNFFDHDFWPAILPAYQVVPQRVIEGRAPVDTAVAAGSVGAPVTPSTAPGVSPSVAPATPPSGAAPAGQPPAGQAAPSGTPPADTSGRPPGTGSAPTER